MSAPQKNTSVSIVAPAHMQALLGAALTAQRMQPVFFFHTRDAAPQKDAKHAVIAVLDGRTGQKSETEGLAPADIFTPPIRLGAVLDRVKKHLSGQGPRLPDLIIALGPYDFHPAALYLIDRTQEKAVHLTEKECEILLFLHEHDGKPVSRAALLAGVWSYAEDMETHTLETHIYRLRQKIEEDPETPRLLLTEEQGYRLEES